MNLRNTPAIRFIADDSIAYGVGMSRIIDEVIARDEERHVPSPEDEAKDEADVLPEEKMKGQPSDGMKEDPEGGTAD